MQNEAKHSLPANAMLREFRITRVLGAGGFGITYLAEDTHLKRNVAIKEYFPTELAWREASTKVVPRTTQNEAPFVKGVESFMNEAQKLARFKHANIVTIHNFFPANGTAYFVMPYYEGESLEEYLHRKKKPLNEAEILKFIHPILNGLEAVHKEKILHRDITPGNIYLRNSGDPLLIDFGAARVAVGKASRSLTMVLTQGYAPMEQYNEKGERQGPWSDIYALGAVMYHCISGNPPPPAPERLVEIYGEKDPYKRAADIGKGKYTEQFLTAIDRALEVKTVAPRPQNVAEMRKLIGKEKTTAAPPVAPPPPAPVKTTGGKLWKIMTALFAIFAVILGVTTYEGFTEAERWESNYWSANYEKRELTNNVSSLNDELEKIREENQNLQGRKISYPRITTYPLTLTKIEFASWDGNNLVNSYGNTLYANNLNYISPRIHYSTNIFFSAGNKDIYVKLYLPNGTLSTGSTSPAGYSYKSSLYLSANSTNKMLELTRWGTDSGGYFDRGWYRFEVWYNSGCIGTASFFVN